ncbi:MAG: exodeoxyribonuclease VII large subunit [Actinomycetes bacterium]
MPLESSPEHPQPLRAVTMRVKGWIERLGAVWVEAQLIELNRRAGRTTFLTLRDTLANVSVNVTVSSLTLDAAGPLTEGATVVARLKPTYYETSGRLSFFCDAITPVGEGRLLARLEQTKRLLQAEGLFDRALKQRLPLLPRGVGLVTGAGSAAERDIVENARRRWPAVRIVTRHALVQGPQACEQVVAAVQALDADAAVDVIVIARGGGSVEDLLPFSDEGLVRAVHRCRTPVVSAIGHETDQPILDLVADVRASTPTDAAKRLVPDAAEERSRLDQARSRSRAAVLAALARQQETLIALRSRPVLADPVAPYAVHAAQVTALRDRAFRAVHARLQREETAISHTVARVRALSPQSTLERGYAVVVDADGHAVTTVAAVAPGAEVTARLADGQLVTTVRTVVPRPEKEALA